MADKDLTYVVSGAKTACTMGLRESKLVLHKDYGIFIKKKPQMTVADCKANNNVLPFGGCISPENPDTQKQMTLMGIPPVAKPVTSVEGAFCGGVVMVASAACAGQCIPVIVGSSWENGKEDTEIDDKQALLGRGTLTCLYGGTITVTDAGQE